MKKKKHIDSKNLDDHLGGSFEAKGDEGKWIGQEVETGGVPLVDDGTGKPIILRCFEFAANPAAFKMHTPTKQELFDNHKQFIRTFLWKDDLVGIEVIPPRILISKKKDKYRIFVSCQPRLGRALAETPATLQQLTKPNATS